MGPVLDQTQYSMIAEMFLYKWNTLILFNKTKKN